MENLQKIEHKGIRVLTTKQLADSYQTDTQMITNNFNRNKDRYKLGKHYICLEGTELSEFKTTNQFDVSSKLNKVYVWTEKGAFLHAKSLNNDIAWEVYDGLVESYFNKQALDSYQIEDPISRAEKWIEEQKEKKKLEQKNSILTVENTTMKPKAEYFDELVDRNLLTGIRETAKELQVKERAFISFLLDKKYVYRDKKGKLMPYAEKNDGLFELKECFNQSTNWTGTQTLVTPRGRETFRLLIQGL